MLHNRRVIPFAAGSVVLLFLLYMSSVHSSGPSLGIWPQSGEARGSDKSQLGSLGSKAGSLSSYGSGSSWHPSNWGASRVKGPKQVKTGGKTVLFEKAIHDEVTGALAHSLDISGVPVEFYAGFRHGFPEVLKEAVSYEPELHNPDDKAVFELLKNDEIRNLVFTTCTDGLTRFKEAIIASSVNVICTIHHAGSPLLAMSDHIKELLHEDRIQFITLGEHVARQADREFMELADNTNVAFLDKLKMHVFIPSFIYPKDRSFEKPAVWPSNVVIQGNIEKGRRNYDKFLGDMLKAFDADPKLWGYKMDDATKAYVPDGGHSPFVLHLLGQRSPQSPVNVPPALINAVVFHEGVPYNEYYDIIAKTDMLVPAFAQGGTFINTASSSMAAALITRTPILVSPRHTAAYTYIQGPAAIWRATSEREMSALERLRRENLGYPPSDGAGTPPADKDTVRLWGEQLRVQWEQFENALQAENTEVWARILK